MANYPVNVWMINESDFDNFTCTGGKVIYVVEEPELRFKTHPSVVSAGALLAPCEAIECILDNELQIATEIYYNYLLTAEANMYILIVIAAAIQGVPLGIMFGKDEIAMQFPAMLLNFLYHYYGLVVGVMGSVVPCIEESFMPNNLAQLYNMNFIDYQTMMVKHPQNLPLSDQAISKLACEINPLVSQKDFQHYYEYFNSVKNSIHGNNEGKFLVDFMEGV